MNLQRLFAGQRPVKCWINSLIYMSNRLHIKNEHIHKRKKKKNIKSCEKFNEFNLNQCDK